MTGRLSKRERFSGGCVALGVAVAAFGIVAAPARATPPVLGSISGVVFHDADGDGVRSPDETGERGVSVTAACVTDEGADSTSRDDRLATFGPVVSSADGSFALHGLAPGPCRVDAKLAGSATNPTVMATSLATAGSLSQFVDAADEPLVVFGVRTSAEVADEPVSEIGNRVWNDENADGVQDPAEPPVADAKIELLDASGATLASARCDADGNYLFTTRDLPGASAPAFVGGLDALAAGGVFSVRVTHGALRVTSPVSIAAGTVRHDIDVGLEVAGRRGSSSAPSSSDALPSSVTTTVGETTTMPETTIVAPSTTLASATTLLPDNTTTAVAPTTAVTTSTVTTSTVTTSTVTTSTVTTSTASTAPLSTVSTTTSPGTATPRDTNHNGVPDQFEVLGYSATRNAHGLWELTVGSGPASTGANTSIPLLIGSGLILVGVAALLASRRRR